MQRLTINNVDVNIFVNDNIKIEKSAVEELATLMETTKTLERLREVNGFFQCDDPELKKVIATPDFHKGSGVPIGTVMLTKGFIIPQAVGNDINCGMRMVVTDLTKEEVQGVLPALTKQIRYLFFEGGRDIPMNKIQREAILREGLTGLVNTHGQAKQRGIWSLFDEESLIRDMARIKNMGSFPTQDAEGFEFYLGEKELSYDDQIGSIGGGNHFVELQVVEEIMDGPTAYGWGLKKDAVVLMIHTGSVQIGHGAGRLIKEYLKAAYPQEMKHPDNGIYLIPDGNPLAMEKAFNLLNSAANFAFANRTFLGLMFYKAVSDVLKKDFVFELLYDTPHNFLWKQELKGETYYLHRKGACPANGMEEMAGTDFAYHGEPVLIPGSMGSSSYVMKGLGGQDNLFSASHGAGRALSRGKAMQEDDRRFEEFMKNFHVITPIDPEKIKGRQDILAKWKDEIKAEAPYAYKEISEIIKTHEEYGMADMVARTFPILTIKG